MAAEEKIKAIKDNFQEFVDAVSVSTLNRILAVENQRIFEDGLCTDGQLINSRRKASVLDPVDKQYSDGHARERRSRGRQTKYIDLELSGRHRRSIIVGESPEGDYSMGFQDERNRKIAEGHTEYRKKQIYATSETALEQGRKTAIIAARKWLRTQLNA